MGALFIVPWILIGMMSPFLLPIGRGDFIVDAMVYVASFQILFVLVVGIITFLIGGRHFAFHFVTAKWVYQGNGYYSFWSNGSDMSTGGTVRQLYEKYECSVCHRTKQEDVHTGWGDR